jgi:hypothetical protein
VAEFMRTMTSSASDHEGQPIIQHGQPRQLAIRVSHL